MIRFVVVTAAAIGLILFVAFVVSRLVASRTRGFSIRMQLFVALALIIGAFAFGLGVMVVDRIEARGARIAAQAARDEATSIAHVLEGELAREGSSLESLAQRLDGERRRGATLELCLIDRDGGVRFPSSGCPTDAGVVSVDAPIVVRGAPLGAVRVVKPTVVMQTLLADFAPTVLVISLILGAAAALAAAWIGRAIARPIEALTGFAERVSEGERTRAPPLVFGREVERLRASLDSMRRQLEGRPFVETFAADLSHELKNPVAGIRAAAELLEDGALDDPEAARRFVSRIRESTLRIERLLAELLGLARIEARGVEGFDPIDLRGVAQAAVDAVGDGRVSLAFDGDARVRGDAFWLTRAAQNLIDNALTHGAGPVHVAVLRKGGEVELAVSNGGSVPSHVRTRLFRRFVTTRASEGGTGLGLAIVRAVAEAHGGGVELARPGPPEVEFRLKLPAAALL